MKKASWMTEEMLTKLLFSLRYYANRWGDTTGALFDTIKGTGFGFAGALDAVDVRGRDAWKDLRPALEGLVALGLVEKVRLAPEWRRAPLYRWGLTPAGFAAKGVGSAMMTAEQLASLDQAIEFHKDDQKRRAERLKMRDQLHDRAAEACAS